jgi:hypothetical protein
MILSLEAYSLLLAFAAMPPEMLLLSFKANHPPYLRV